MVDVTVDGADEVDPQLNGIKVAGGALPHGKIVATNSKIAFGSWMNQTSHNSWLSNFQWKWCNTGLENLSVILSKRVTIPFSRLTDDQRFVTDQGNFM